MCMSHEHIFYQRGKPVHYGRFHFVVTTFKREFADNPIASKTHIDVASRLGLNENDIGVWLCRDKELDFDGKKIDGGYAYRTSVGLDILPALPGAGQ